MAAISRNEPRSDGLITHRAAGPATGLSAAEATVSRGARVRGGLGRHRPARDGQTPDLVRGGFGLVVVVRSGRVPRFVVRGKETGAWNAQRLSDALASYGDLRASRADGKAWSRLRDVDGHTGRDPDSPPEAKSPCHLADSMGAAIPRNNRSPIIAGPAPSAGADRPSSVGGRRVCPPNP